MALGLAAHEWLSCAAETAVFVESTRSSYGRTVKVLGKDAEISKTAVIDKVHAVQAELPFEKLEKKKCVEYLYIDTGEDYIHKQAKTVPEKKKQVDRIEIEYIMGNWQAICENPFNRAYALNVLCRTQNEHLMKKMLIETYRFNTKDASYYYYSTVYWINNKDQIKALQNAKAYLELTSNNLYERLDSEREECISFIKGVFIR